LSIFIKLPLGKKQLTPRQILRDPVLFLAFGFGSGLAKKAPGTFGTLAAIPVYLLCVQAGLAIYSLLTVLVILFGVWCCGQAAEQLGEHDFGGIVWDEIAGFLVTMWLVPLSWQAVVIGFVLFRLLDIAKPWPISWVDRKIGGGLGIMCDDVLAGIIAALLLRLILNS
jgi:phosphatidylglycerophosphatase A